MKFTAEQNAQLLNTLGLPTDTADADLVLATAADMASQAAAGKPSDIAAAAKAQGLEVVDSETLIGLRAAAAEGQQIRAAAERQKVLDVVDNAARKGKITPARREHWVNLITADPAMADVLNAVPDETAIPLKEVGHGVDGEAGRIQTGQSEWFY